MARATLHLSALTNLALVPLTAMRAAFSAVDWARTFGLPGYQPLVAKPARIRTTTDAYYRGNNAPPSLFRNHHRPRRSRRVGTKQ